MEKGFSYSSVNFLVDSLSSIFDFPGDSVDHDVWSTFPAAMPRMQNVNSRFVAPEVHARSYASPENAPPGHPGFS